MKSSAPPYSSTRKINNQIREEIMTEKEKTELAIDILNRFSESGAEVGELIDFGIIIIELAAIANKFPHHYIQKLVAKVSYTLVMTQNEMLKHEQN